MDGLSQDVALTKGVGDQTGWPEQLLAGLLQAPHEHRVQASAVWSRTVVPCIPERI
jgi:hypothetical protein